VTQPPPAQPENRTLFSGLTPNARGMLAMTAASMLFVCSDALSKIVSQTWTVGQMMAVRGIFAILLALSVTLITGAGRRLPMIGRPVLIVRSMLEGSVALTFLYALSLMPLADLTSILMLSPLAITIVSIVAFKEVVGWRRWSAILAGFAGMLLVVQPGGAASAAPNYAFAASLGLCSVLGVAMRDTLTRRLSSDIPSVVITVAASIGSCLAGFILAGFQGWNAFAWGPLFACLAAAIIVTAGNLLLILACRGVDLSVVAPYRYSAVVWSIAMGMMVFGDVPNGLSFVGMAIITASGLYTMHRERLRRRQATAEAASQQGQT
jgi:drug/metabolite transporter (DMT)-like permease